MRIIAEPKTAAARLRALGLVTFLFLGACDTGFNQGASAASTESKVACVSTIEKLGMRRGMEARQVVLNGKLSKARPVVYWATPDFTGTSEVKSEAGQIQNLQVLLGWRIGAATEGAPEAILDSLIVRAKGLDPKSVPAGALWRISIVDNERHDVEFSPPAIGKPIEAKLSPEGGGGLVIPDMIADALGGINGGRFEVALVDGNGIVIARRDVSPPRGYEFKLLAEKAVDGLKAVALKPEACSAPVGF